MRIVAIQTQPSTTGDTTVIADDLQATVVDLIALGLVAKQAHWNVAGSGFKSIHLQLDDIVEATRAGTDRAAERLASIGGSPDGRPETVAGTHSGEIPGGTIRTEDVISTMGGVLDGVTRGLRERIHRLGDPDPISQGILIDIADELEKQAWMLRAHLAPR
jgi:starvation-inducible DNA-binding protein